ncbi:MAG: hypothetical protein H6667_03990 [Ardenticatenaceae bacterium]|nr:hypothetical protein [Ardenticatenaceae bacterium]MCB9446631.1 hypothetical protein [Ardenticatenaceae bacterium]
MESSRWQKQYIYLRSIVWGASAVIAILLFIILVSLGMGIDAAGGLFIVVFFTIRVSLAFILKNRYANSMVRILKFDYEELERDFRTVFKNKYIRFRRKSEEDVYSYEFPGHNLSMIVQPYWLSSDITQPVTLVTLRILNAKNEAFAEMLAESIDEMAEQRANGGEKA